MTAKNPTKKRRAAWIGLSAAAVIVAGSLATGAVITTASADSVQIDGMRISSAELDIAEQRVARTAEQKGADVTDAAADQLRDDMALFQVARDLGVSDVERPSDILDQREQVNAERKAAQQRGEPVYGPVTLGARDFYGKALAQIREAAVEKIRTSDEITEEDVRARFDEDPSQWALTATRFDLTASRVQTADETFDDGSHSQVEVTMDELRGSWNPDLAQWVEHAHPGDISAAEPDKGAFVFYRLDGTEVDEDQAYASYRNNIRGLLADEELDSRIRTAREAQE